MIEFKKPVNLNGAQLIEELNAVGIAIDSDNSPLIDGNGKFWLGISSKDETKAKAIVESHNGVTVPADPTIDEKLASVGLSVNDLKTALGL